MISCYNNLTAEFTAANRQKFYGSHRSMSQFQQEFVTTAIEHYGLELEDDRVDTVILMWFQTYDPAWVVKALVEALYRGRYKVKSVDNILRDWQRRGSPFYKFTPDYEREILHSLRLNIDSPVTLLPSVIPTSVDIAVRPRAVDPPPSPERERLDPEETAPFQHHDLLLLAIPSGGEEHPSESEPELTHSNDAANERHRSSIPSMPDRSEILSEYITPPAKLHLFHKLREIVDPNDRRHHNIQQSM
jgi:hypothetical protein